MKNLYIDFDGVILDTITPLYDFFEERKLDIKTSSKEELSNAVKEFPFKEYINDDYIINDSIECIKKLNESDKFVVSILTHINTLEEGVIKTKYIRKYFKDITMILVPKQISKTKMIHTEGSILVDDYAHNLREWEEENGIGVRFNKNLNSKGFKVVNKLDMLLDMF